MNTAADEAIDLAATHVTPLFAMHGWRRYNHSQPPSADEIARTFRELVSYVRKPTETASFERLAVHVSSKEGDNGGRVVELLLLLGEFELPAVDAPQVKEPV